MNPSCAFVTGGGAGIGAAIARRLARVGHRVAVAGRTLEKCTAVAEDIRAAGGLALAVACEVSDPASVEAAVARVEAELGGIDLLVNNAGTHSGKRLLETSDEDWRNIVGASLDGAFFCSRACVARMRLRGRGHIVTIASQAAGWAGPWEFAYGIAKGAQVRLTLHLLTELELIRKERQIIGREPGLFVAHVLCPGPVATAINQTKLAAGQKLQPTLDPDEVAESVVVLASNPTLGRSALAEHFRGRFQVGSIGLFEAHEAIIRLWRE